MTSTNKPLQLDTGAAHLLALTQARPKPAHVDLSEDPELTIRETTGFLALGAWTL